MLTASVDRKVACHGLLSATLFFLCEVVRMNLLHPVEAQLLGLVRNQ